MAALTKAVYDSALQEDEPPEPTALRLLPGGATAAALLIVLVLLGCIGVWRHATAAEHAAEQSAEQSSQQEADTPEPEQRAPTNRGASPPTNTPASDQVIVYVSGGVVTPGVLTLPGSSRVVDAITAAGGARDDANLDTINLARPLVDGEHIRVPIIGEPESATAQGEAPTQACVRLDTATAADLQTLPGIGPALAARIIDYRTTHPHVSSVDALDEVPGIGPSLIEKIRPGVCP